MRVLGIDPGLRRTGWGVVDVKPAKITHVANGICASKGTDLANRLHSLFVQLTEVLERWTPDAAAVEHTFVNKDAAGTLKLGQARATESVGALGEGGRLVADFARRRGQAALDIDCK